MKKKKTEKISFYKFFQRFPDEEATRKFFENKIWGRTGRYCPHCGGFRTVETKNHKPMPYRCKDCRKHFSVRTRTILEESRIPLHKWLLAIFLLTTNLKGVSSYKLARDLGVTQKTAWFLAHRIRKLFEDQIQAKLESPLEADETYIGGKLKNMHASKRPINISGAAGKTPVVAVKSRASKKVKAKVTKPISSMTLQRMIEQTVDRVATIYTDQHQGYVGLKHKGYKHASVNHGIGEYIRGEIHTNSVEGFFSMFKRGYVGVYHKMSEKHLQRYINEYVGRHNNREEATMRIMSNVAKDMLGKRLTWEELTAEMPSETKFVI